MRLNRHLLLALAGLAAALLAAGPALAADGFEPLGGRDEVREIEGQSVTLPIRPELRVVTAGSVNDVTLRVTIGLADLRAKAPAILGSAVARKSGDIELSLPELATVIEAGALKLRGKLRASNDDLLVEITETAEFTLALTPQSDAASLSVVGSVERLDLGGGLLDALGAGGFLSGLVGEALENGLNRDDVLFRMPEDLAEFGFTFSDVALTDANGGELSAAANAQLDGSQLTRLLSTLATRFQQP